MADAEHEKRFSGELERLRAPERVARLELARVVDECLKGGAFASLLDVGTGTGLFAEAFAGRGLAVAGVDVNPAALAAARSFVPAGNFQEGTAEALPVPDAAIDLVFLGLVLHEADDPLQALKEARRAARKRAAVLEWPYRAQAFGPPLAHRLDPVELEQRFHQAGFPHWTTIELEATVLYLLDV